MTTDPPVEPSLAIGFLTVVDQPSQGLIGGYLLLNAHARPLEFHCTVPIRANRAQEILYGATLQPYLYGEQIGPTLVKTSKLRPLALFTDCAPALGASAFVDCPVWLVLPPEEVGSDRPLDQVAESRDPRGLAPQQVPPGMSIANCGRNRLARPAIGTDGAALGERLNGIATALDLSEPFERIRAAIEESQRGGR